MGCEIEELGRNEKTKQDIAYGCDELGRLKSVLIHTPGEELSLINESNYEYWLYDKVPEISGYIKEHKSYQELLNQTVSRSMSLKITWMRIKIRLRNCQI